MPRVFYDTNTGEIRCAGEMPTHNALPNETVKEYTEETPRPLTHYTFDGLTFVKKSQGDIDAIEEAARTATDAEIAAVLPSKQSELIQLIASKVKIKKAEVDAL